MPSYGKVQMVVIEYTGGITAHSAALQGGLPPTFCLDLTKAIQQLHDAGFVLGNQLRNMMVTEEDNLYLIDPGWTV
jgi:tRNA A-37 threonylcarbamoyl transferase component Bud32